MPEHVTPDLSIRGGLLEPKHCARMGEALWLYLYLHSIVQFSGEHAGELFPGRVYQHADAAAALGKPRRTIERWFATLLDEGYVTVIRHRLGYEIVVTKYEDVRQRAKEQRARLATNGVSQDTPNLTRDTPKSVLRLAKSGVSRNKDARANPNVQENPTDSPPGVPPMPAAAPVPKALTPLQVVVNAWLTAIGRDPAKVRDYGQYVRVGAEMAARGDTPQDIGNCTRWMQTEPWRKERGKPPSLAEVRDALPAWIELRRPAKFSPLPRDGGAKVTVADRALELRRRLNGGLHEPASPNRSSGISGGHGPTHGQLPAPRIIDG